MNWQVFFNSMYQSIVRTVKKDWIYVILLCVNVTLLFGVQSHKESNELDSSGIIENSVQDVRRGQLFDMLQEGETNQGFVVLAGVLLAAVIAGIVLLIVFLLRGFPCRKKQCSIASITHEEVQAEEDVAYSTNLDTVQWTFWDVCKVLIVFFSAYFSFSVLQELALSLLGVSGETINYDFLMIMDMFFSEIVAIFFLLRFVRVHHGVSLRSFGLHVRRFGMFFLFGLASYLMFLPAFFLINIVTILVGKMFSIELQPQEIFYMFTQESHFSAYQMGVVVLFVSVIGPLFEEIFFRGFVYRIVKKYCGYIPALLISALFFAYVHHNFMAFLPIFALGIILGVLLERTGSLVSSVVMHALVNSVSLALLFTLIHS